MKELKYAAIIHDDPDGLTVEIPDFGAVTEGETVEECLAMAQEAIDGLIESHLANGFPIPAPSRPTGEDFFYVVRCRC